MCVQGLLIRIGYVQKVVLLVMVLNEYGVLTHCIYRTQSITTGDRRTTVRPYSDSYRMPLPYLVHDGGQTVGVLGENLR